MFDNKCINFGVNLGIYLPFDDVLDDWCGGDDNCRKLKKSAIIIDCQNKEIKYCRSDDKNFDDPIQQLIGKGVFMIHREDFEQWVKKFDDKDKAELPLSIRSEKTYRNIIGALLEVTTGKFKDESFLNEAKLIDFFQENVTRNYEF